MASVNKAIILGTCGRDPEIRHLQSGKTVANVSVATSTKRKDKQSGEYTEETQWHRITFYDRMAEIAGEYLKKGSQVYVEGRIAYGKYTDKNGVEKNTVDIIATEMQLMGKPPQRENQIEPTRKPAKPKEGSGFDDMDADIPF